MAEKKKPRNGILSTFVLLLVVLCIFLILGFQIQQVSDVLRAEPSPTPLPVSSSGGGSGISVQEEDVLPTPTPGPAN